MPIGVRISEIGPSLDKRQVTTAGWVLEKRDLGKMKFLLLRDKDGVVQITYKSGQVDPSVSAVIDSLRQNDVIRVEGLVAKSDIAKLGIEILPTKIDVLSRCVHPIPLDVTGRIRGTLDTRLDHRPLDLTRRQPRSVFLLRSQALKLMRDFLHGRGFVEVTTPRIIVSATEGGASLFKLQYFDKAAFLAQSPQLYKEQLTMSLERVFEIGTFFRAEPFDTTRHLNEFTSVDIECAFYDMYDVMAVAEEMIKCSVDGLRQSSGDALEVLGARLPDVSRTFRRVTYGELLEMVKDKGGQLQYGQDMTPEAIRCALPELGEFYFITHWPESTKPFYIKTRPNGETESFDLMYKELELGSGGTREENKERLIGNMNRRSLGTRGFETHLKTFDFGMPPHAGWGIGFDRVLMCVLGLENIREVVIYPRDRFRLEP